MSSDEKYWAERAIKREAYWNKQCREVIEKRLASQYNKTARSIMQDIAALYGQFADENGLSIKEATALIRGEEFREWRMSLEEYAALAEKDNAVLKELNTLAMRSRITRLEKLYGDTLKELYKLGKATDKSITAFLGDAYKDNYYKSLYEIGKTAGIQGAISAVNTKTLEGVLRTPWSGKNYSERIWDNSRKLADTLRDTMSAGIHRGLSVPKLSKMVQERMGVGRYEATRLVRTELNYVHNQANLDSIKDSGMGFYKFVATLDHRTSQKCRAHDGSIVPVEEASPGDNLPPLHPHCRSTIIGSLGEGKGGQKGTRIARDSKGRTFHVPQQMTYKDYKAVYIDQSKPIAQWAKEAGIAGNLAKYTPKVSSQGNGSNGIIEPTEGQLGRRKANTGEFEGLEVPMQLRAVKQVCAEYGYDISGLRLKIQRDPHLLNLPYYAIAAHEQMGRIDLFPSAFSDKEQLIRTIIHENIHVKQFRKYGAEFVQKNQARMEKVAYRAESIIFRLLKRRR